MKNVLVPAAGSASDQVVFETALAAARPLGAHLDFFHMRLSAGEAALHTSHADFAQGAALKHLLEELQQDQATRSRAARKHVVAFCEANNIGFVDTPHLAQSVSAGWDEENDPGAQRLMTRARHCDLVVLGRARGRDGLPHDLKETLLLGCGRPILIAATHAPPTLTGTVMVCWKETAEAARAVAAATSLLSKARRVVLVGVDEDGRSAAALQDLAYRMGWQGIVPEIHALPPDGRPTAEILSSTAMTLGADLLVMGGYGRGRGREVIFGGCTQSLLEDAALPVLLAH